MRKFIVGICITLLPFSARADLWGADLPLLAEIVFNTLHTMMELEQQTSQMNDQLDGIKDKIHRIRTIADIVQPSTWEKWKDPEEALRRLQLIYHRSEKSDTIETEISKAMNMIARVRDESHTTFNSGKELERRGADASPGVAQKLTASGVGTLIALESQTQTIQSQTMSLLAQMLADANDKETRSVVARGSSFNWFHQNLRQSDGKFSTQVFAFRKIR
jgi:hypothetical protein